MKYQLSGGARAVAWGLLSLLPRRTEWHRALESLPDNPLLLVPAHKRESARKSEARRRLLFLALLLLLGLCFLLWLGLLEGQIHPGTGPQWLWNVYWPIDLIWLPLGASAAWLLIELGNLYLNSAALLAARAERRQSLSPELALSAMSEPDILLGFMLPRLRAVVPAAALTVLGLSAWALLHFRLSDKNHGHASWDLSALLREPEAGPSLLESLLVWLPSGLAGAAKAAALGLGGMLLLPLLLLCLGRAQSWRFWPQAASLLNLAAVLGIGLTALSFVLAVPTGSSWFVPGGGRDLLGVGFSTRLTAQIALLALASNLLPLLLWPVLLSFALVLSRRRAALRAALGWTLIPLFAAAYWLGPEIQAGYSPRPPSLALAVASSMADAWLPLNPLSLPPYVWNCFDYSTDHAMLVGDRLFETHAFTIGGLGGRILVLTYPYKRAGAVMPWTGIGFCWHWLAVLALQILLLRVLGREACVALRQRRSEFAEQ